MTNTEKIFNNKVLGHPAGLFVLFFTEMWERFSYYGMRGLFVLFLTSTLINGGWEWPREHALSLYGTYTGMVYLTPILGGWVADKILGYNKAIVLGATLMTIGHACMALETPMTFYIGLLCIIFGNGFFKPNMASVLSQMYINHADKKDSAFTIFYMGVNAGAFFGFLLCGYLGERVGWNWGFGLAGIFMALGTLQYYLSRGIFEGIGEAPVQTNAVSQTTANIESEENGGKLNPFTSLDTILMGITATLALVWIINDPMSKIYGFNLFGNSTMAGYVIIFTLGLFLFILFSRISRYWHVTKDRMIAVFCIAIFYMFFWACFEQAGGSMTVFADAYSDRTLEGGYANFFKLADTLLTVVPLVILSYVLFALVKQTFANYAVANIILVVTICLLWAVVIYKIKNEYSMSGTEIPASWFGSLNAFFIITLGPIFTRIWDSKFNPSVHFKYGLGLLFLGIGFLALAYGASDIPLGAATAQASIIWLIIAYLFHTLGELCISPVGLSYVSKLVPGRMIGIVFGIWYLAIAVGNKLAGTIGENIDKISEAYGLSKFFLIFTAIPFIGALVVVAIGPILKKLMHGYK
jgi:proton-dependent oligopeptide transporter, POT family